MQPGGLAVGAGLIDALSAVGDDEGDERACPGDQSNGEFNRPRRLARVGVCIPPSPGEIESLFQAWRAQLPRTAGAGSWRRRGITWRRRCVGVWVCGSTRRSGCGWDWYPGSGAYGVLHVRCGKGARGSGPRQRLVPAIDGVDRLLAWWLTEVRPQFGDEPAGGQAVLLPSRRHSADGGRRPACAVTLRDGLARAVAQWLPAWEGRLTPHPLRHFCASYLYARGVGLEAVGALLGHRWLSTTAPLHVPAERIEQCWQQANDRLTGRLLGPGP
ncbi:tyrosine-type recombinase/integrase [Streptomyces sp. NPDC005141]